MGVIELEVKMTITTHYGGFPRYFSFTKEVETLDDLKTAFLKRFGNRNSETNKLMRQKPLVKQLTYEAKTSKEWVRSVNLKTDWELSIVLTKI